MTSIGETLRRERLKRNLELGQIAQELKISSRFLEAIEAGQLDKLPGGVFTKSFVLQYARFLGLDEEEIAGEMQRVLEPPPEVPELVDVSKPADSGIRVPPVEAWDAVGGGSRIRWSSSLAAAALVVVVMLGCSGLYAWWQHARRPVAAPESPPVAAVQPPPAPVQPSAPPAAEPSTAAAETTPAQSAGLTPTTQPVSGAPAPAPAPSTEQPAPPAKAPPPPVPVAKASESNPNAPVRVEVTADEPVWVLARSDGKYLFSGTLGAKESRTIEANSTVMLRLGNAGGVAITLNGKPIGPVGPKGQVRTVQLTSGGFQIVAAPKSPVPLDPL